MSTRGTAGSRHSWRRGDRIEGYTLADRIGGGAFGAVWRARGADGGPDVVVKILKSDLAERSDFRASFAREAKALARLRGCRHVVDVIEYSIDGPVFLVMGHVPGRPLSKLLADRGLGPARAVAVADQLAVALEAVHAANLVHGDVTPANVLVDERDGADEVCLVDFGLVGAVDDPMFPSTVLFEDGIGTLRYLAPERIARARVIPTVAHDVYGLACVLYESLTGREPFGQRTRWGIERAARRARRPRPSDVDRTLRPFDDLVADGLAPDPADRIATVTAFRTRLHDVAGLSNEPGPGVSTGSP